MALEISIVSVKNMLKGRLGNDFLELLRHAKNYITASVFVKALSFISIPVFTHLLVPGEYGVLAVFQSFVAILGIIYGMGLKGSVTRYYYEKTGDFYEFFGSILIFILITGCLLSVIFFLSADIFASLFNIPTSLIYFGLIVSFSRSFYLLFQAYLVASKQSKRLSAIEIFEALFLLVISIIVTIELSENRYLGKIYTELFIAFALLATSIFFITKHSKLSLRRKHIKYALYFSLPIVIHSASQYVLNTFDQVMINKYSGARATGLYSVAYKIGMLQTIIAAGMLRAWTPIFFEKLNEKRYDDIDGLARKYSKIIFLIAIALILFAKETITLLTDTSYHESFYLIPLIVIGYLFHFLYTLYVNYSFYEKKTLLIALFTVSAGLLNILLNYIFIPKYGYSAAAYTTLVSYFALYIFNYSYAYFWGKTKKVIHPGTYLPFFLPLILVLLLNGFLERTAYQDTVLITIKFLILLVASSFLLRYGKDESN